MFRLWSSRRILQVKFLFIVNRTFNVDFSSCADISIGSKENEIYLPIPTMKTTHQPIIPYPVDYPNEMEYLPFFPSPMTTTQPSSTTETVDFIYPYHPSEESPNRSNPIKKTLRCYATHEVLKPLIGIENWCLKICVVHCPPTLCACVHI